MSNKHPPPTEAKKSGYAVASSITAENTKLKISNPHLGEEIIPQTTTTNNNPLALAAVNPSLWVLDYLDIDN